MGLLNKLKEILFDEETVEIPVITKENKNEEKPSTKKVKEEPEQYKRSIKDDDEVIIRKIETPKREEDEELFDMPKLKEEAKEEVKSNTFTFPIFDDDEKEEAPSQKRRTLKETKSDSKRSASTEKRASGYTNAFDYSYGKYKGDYKSSRESNQEVLSKSLEIKEEKKAFTPSPIISPVYGILNENYKKEDIVTKSEKTRSRASAPLDLDSVRRKAYGTLEDEIEVSLGRTSEETLHNEEVDVLEEDGISITDLLVDSEEETMMEENVTKLKDDTELFGELEDDIIDVPEEIDLDENIEDVESNEEVSDDIREYQIEKEKVDSTELSSEPLKAEKTDNKKEPIGEDDLFDLIDSLYEGKGDE